MVKKYEYCEKKIVFCFVINFFLLVFYFLLLRNMNIIHMTMIVQVQIFSNGYLTLLRYQIQNW